VHARRAGEMRQYPSNQLNSTTKFSSSMYTGYETAVITVYRYSCTLVGMLQGQNFPCLTPTKLHFGEGNG